MGERGPGYIGVLVYGIASLDIGSFKKFISSDISAFEPH